MNKKRKELECLARLQTLTQGLDEILQFLREENLLDEVEIKAMRSSSDYPKETFLILNRLKEKQFQLLSYEWTILPVENITVLIVTDRTQRTFKYEG
jgi:hypothetical protein